MLKLKILHPTQFQRKNNINFQSPLFLAEDINLVDIMEVVSGIFLSKKVISRSGNPIPLSVIGRSFELFFNIKLGDIHKKHESVISRKPSKRTEFIDSLRKAIQKESKEKGYL